MMGGLHSMNFPQTETPLAGKRKVVRITGLIPPMTGKKNLRQ